MISAPRYDQRRHNTQIAGTALIAPKYSRSTPTSPLSESTNVDTTGSRESDLSALAEPLLEQLRTLGAAEYALEQWGTGGQLYRFRCAMRLAESDELTRQFEAVAADPLASIKQVVGEVASWRTARLADGPLTR